MKNKDPLILMGGPSRVGGTRGPSLKKGGQRGEGALKKFLMTVTTSKLEEKKLRKLYRSRENKILAGVCGGLGEYFQIDPVIIRLLWIVLSLVWGFGVILYIIAIFIIPPEPQQNHYSDSFEETPENEHHHVSHNLEDEDRKVVIGLFALLFIVIGLIILVSIITPSTFFFRNFIKIVISILLIGIGAYLISTSRTKK